MIGKLSSSFYCGFEKQRELTLMNTMQVRKEALRIISKLNGACGERGVMGSVPGGRKHRLLSVLVPHRSSWLWKIVFVIVCVGRSQNGSSERVLRVSSQQLDHMVHSLCPRVDPSR